MADLEKIMNISADDIEKIMGVSKDDIENVMGVAIPSNARLGDRGIGTSYHEYGRSSGTWYNNNIHFRSISGSSHSAKFGEFAAIGSDANVAVHETSGLSGGGRGLFQGGNQSTDSGSSFPYGDTMWYITIASTGDASTGNDLPAIGGTTGFLYTNEGGGSNGVTGIIHANNSPAGVHYNTIASTASASVGGDVSASIGNVAGCGGPTYVFFVGGFAFSTRYNDMQYMAYATPGNNAADWGDLTAVGQHHKSCDSDSRTITWGYYGDGDASPITDAMNYWNNTSTGNAAVFGNGIGPTCATNSTTFGKYSGMAMSNGTRGERWSGWAITHTPSAGNCSYLGDMNVDFVTIASTGNAADSGYNFSDLDSKGTSYTDHYSVGISG